MVYILKPTWLLPGRLFIVSDLCFFVYGSLKIFMVDLSCLPVFGSVLMVDGSPASWPLLNPLATIGLYGLNGLR